MGLAVVSLIFFEVTVKRSHCQKQISQILEHMATSEFELGLQR